MLRVVLQENMNYQHDSAETRHKAMMSSNSGFDEHGGTRANVSRGTTLKSSNYAIFVL